MSFRDVAKGELRDDGAGSRVPFLGGIIRPRVGGANREQFSRETTQIAPGLHNRGTGAPGPHPAIRERSTQRWPREEILQRTPSWFDG